MEEVFVLRVTREQLSALGQEGYFDGLRALRDNPDGLTYTDLHYGALARKNATNVMRGLMRVGLVEKYGSKYVITAAGINVLPHAEAIDAAGSSSGAPNQPNAAGS